MGRAVSLMLATGRGDSDDLVMPGSKRRASRLGDGQDEAFDEEILGG